MSKSGNRGLRSRNSSMSGKAFSLSLVTWKQQEDRRWFGARIPAASKSVELVVAGTAAEHRLWTVSRRTSEDDIRPASPSPNYRATELLGSATCGRRAIQGQVSCDSSSRPQLPLRRTDVTGPGDDKATCPDRRCGPKLDGGRQRPNGTV